MGQQGRHDGTRDAMERARGRRMPRGEKELQSLNGADGYWASIRTYGGILVAFLDGL